MKYVPLKVKTHYSLQESLIKPEKLAEELARLNIGSCAITDSGSISGAVEFSSKLQKQKIKPILGVDLLIRSNNPLFGGWLTLIAKNEKGWKNLIKLTSISNNKANLVTLHDKDFPSLVLSDLVDCSDLICLVGQPYSYIANQAISDYNTYYLKDDQHIAGFIKPDAVDSVVRSLQPLKDIFGKENLFLNIQTSNQAGFPVAKPLANVMREAAKKADLLPVACLPSNYLHKGSKQDHELVLLSLLKTTNKKFLIQKNPELAQYFFSENHYLIQPDEVLNFGNTEAELQHTNLISDMCEEYTLTSKVRAPKFECPTGMSEMDYLRQLAKEGFEKRKKSNWDAVAYQDRLNLELNTIEKAGLAGYFLIVQDYVNYCKKQGWLIGPGRGSAGGSLASYLIGITMVDPIPFGLLFERFYNDGRNTADRIAFPDIDVDFPISKRENVIEYIRDKYGRDKVGQMVTFGRMQGRGALKEVFRVYDVCDPIMANEITKDIPQEHEINDKLEEEGEESIIRWTLENDPDAVKEYCRLTDGKLTGDYAQYFDQAIRVEGLYRSQGKHAAGLVISPEPLNELCPMISDKSSEEKIVGYDMHGVEAIGLLKMDILGLAILDKLMEANNLLKGTSHVRN